MLKDIESLGYNNYYKVLNAKNYGIPQNRERVFIVSIRKDVDNGKFEFPKGFDNGLRLKDFLEDEVEEKFYISEEKTKRLLYCLKDTDTLSARDYKEPRLIVEKRQMGRRFKENGDPTFTINTQDRHGILESKLIQVGNLESAYDQSNRVYSKEGISPTIMSNSHIGGYTTPKILENNCIQLGSFKKEDINDNERQRRVYSIEGVSPTILARTDNAKILCIDDTQDRHGILESIRLGGIFDGDKKHQAGSVWDKEGLCPTLDTMQGGYRQPSIVQHDFRIRKLTPLECWRLMGFTDEEFQKAQDAGISNSQLYKQAGNSIVTNVLAAIFENMDMDVINK